MTDSQTVQNSFDDRTHAVLSQVPAIPFLFGNQVNVAISEGTAPWVKQSVNFLTDKQAELGNSCFRRVRGYVLFFVYVRVGTGNYHRNVITDRIIAGFASRNIGPATTLDAQMIPSPSTENWAVTAIQIPFYYDSPRN